MDTDEIIKRARAYIEKECNSQIIEQVGKEKSVFFIDFKKLSKSDYELADQLLDNPQDVMACFDIAISEIDGINEGFARFYNLPKSQKVPIRALRSKHIGKLIYVEGIVRSRTDVRPQARTVKYECPNCGNIMTVVQLDNVQRQPSVCECGRKGRFRIVSKELYDAQALALEEDITELGEDTIPKRVGVLLKDDLTDINIEQITVPGKNVRIIGILKEVQLTNKYNKTNKYDLVLEANYVEPLERNLTKREFSAKEIRQFRKLSKDKDLFKKLINSVAPHIYGYDQIKFAILLFIVKGVPKKSARNGVLVRDFFHILLIGDPGTGKSQFGKEVLNLSYKCKIAIGKGASGVGLTASAERDEFLGQRVIRAGTLPLCNGGHVVIDEVDKMDEEVQSHLLSAMEDGVIKIDKSQVQGTLKADVGIFMIGNPKFGRFDPYGPIVEQLNLSAPLISRFDLIFPIRDEPSPDHDKKLIEKIINKHRDIEHTTDREIPLDLLVNYLFYASTQIRPKLSNAAIETIRNYVIKLRAKSGTDMSKSVKITARQIEAIIRIAEAIAKLRLAAEVSSQDAEMAISLANYSMTQVGIDPETGEVDIDIIMTGVSSSARRKRSELERIIMEVQSKNGNLAPFSEIVSSAKKAGFAEHEIESLINKMRQEGDIYEPRRGFFQLR